MFIDYPIRGFHTLECAKFKIQKIKHLFIIIEVQLITISGVIPYTSETKQYKQFPQKKKSSRKKEERKTRWKRGTEEERDGKEENKRKGMERVCAKGKEK